MLAVVALPNDTAAGRRPSAVGKNERGKRGKIKKKKKWKTGNPPHKICSYLHHDGGLLLLCRHGRHLPHPPARRTASPLTKAGKPSKSAKPQPQQRHLVQITPSQTTLPQLRVDAYRLFGASLEHYDVELRVGFPPKLIGVGDGREEDEETLVKDFVGRNESVTVRFVPSGGNKKKNNKNGNIRTSGSGIVGVSGGAAGGGGSAARAAPKKPALKTTASAAAGKKRSRPAASATADDADEYDPNAADADDGSDDGGDGNNGQDAAANANGGRKSKRAASAAASAAMPAIIREQDRLIAAQGGGKKKKAAKKKVASPAASSGNSNNNLAAARAAAAEKRAAAAAVRKMAAMPGRRLGDGSDVAPTSAAAAATRKKKGGRGTNTLFGNMSSEDDVSYALMGSMAGGAGGGAGGGKIGKVLRTAMKGAVGKSYEASRAVVRVDAVRAGKFRIVAKSDAASAGASGGSGIARGHVRRAVFQGRRGTGGVRGGRGNHRPRGP